MTLALIGAAMGAVLFWLVRSLAPPAVSPAVRLAQFDVARRRDPRGSAAPSVTSATIGPGSTGSGVLGLLDGLQVRLGRPAAALLQRRGIAYASLRQDLALTGRSWDAMLGQKILSGAAGFFITLCVAFTLDRADIVGVPAGAGLLVAVLVGAGFFLVPDIDARRNAAARRADFRRALRSYLVLVVLEMAGSAAPAEALPAAARIGAGWPLALIRDTLFRATRSGRDPWDALSELGSRIGVPELQDLGSLVHLVEHDGAQVRETLTARAATMGRKELSDAEGKAGQRDQSMQVANILIGFGFMVFLAYPAIANVLAF